MFNHPTSVFLCYRRDDSGDVTGRIYDRLEIDLGEEAVFKDVDAIPYGVDFREHIRETLERARVVLVIIGPKWEQMLQERGLEDAADHVRIEIEQSLGRKGLPVVPLLVGGAKMPREESLPHSIRSLVFRHGPEIRRDPDFRHDMEKLVKRLRVLLETKPELPKPPPAPPKPSGISLLDDDDFQLTRDEPNPKKAASDPDFELTLSDPDLKLSGDDDDDGDTVISLDDEDFDFDLYSLREEPEKAAAAAAAAAAAPAAAPVGPRPTPYRRRQGSNVALVMFIVMMILVTIGVLAYIVVAEQEKKKAAAQAAPPPGVDPAELEKIRAFLNEREAEKRAGNPRFATREKPFSNSLGMKFVPVPGTKVLVGIWETRVQDFEAYVKADRAEGWTLPKYGPLHRPSPRHPVTGVSWQAAREFCVWLSTKEGRRYRLPTDHEWSCAAGIGRQEDPNASPKMKSGKVEGPWWKPAGSWPPPSGAGNFADAALTTADATRVGIEGYDDGFPYTSPAGSFPPNALGIHDLGGNASEWCEDLLSAEDPQRVLRGGNYGDRAPQFLEMSSRLGGDPNAAAETHGFRVVLALE